MFVSKRHQKPVELLRRKFCPEGGQAVRRGRHQPQARMLLCPQGIYTCANVCGAVIFEQIGQHIICAVNIGQECRSGNSFQQGGIYLGLHYGGKPPFRSFIAAHGTVPRRPGQYDCDWRADCRRVWEPQLYYTRRIIYRVSESKTCIKSS